MNEHFVPTQYHLEVYENSLENDPSYFLQSSTPFSAISVGDYFNHRTHDGWNNPPDNGNGRFVIAEIEHIFWAIDKSHNGHKLMVVVKRQP